MASTRNKNTIGNYSLEQRDNQLSAQRNMYPTAQNDNTRFAGNGLNPGQMPGHKLSHNSPDIESYLFGINSTNLVSSSFSVNPQLTSLDMAHLYEKTVVLMPRPLVLDKDQRPQFN